MSTSTDLRFFIEAANTVLQYLHLPYSVSIAYATPAELRQFSVTQYAALCANPTAKKQRILLRKPPQSQSDVVMTLFAIAHEIRHLFQIHVVHNKIPHLCSDVWTTELTHNTLAPKDSDSLAAYNLREVELDANAFAIYFMKLQGIALNVQDFPNAAALQERITKFEENSLN